MRNIITDDIASPIVDKLIKEHFHFDYDGMTRKYKKYRRYTNIAFVISMVLFITAVYFSFRNKYQVAYMFLLWSMIANHIQHVYEDRTQQLLFDTNNKLHEMKEKLLTFGL